jgi:cell wall-associated NlpC family hydrolase
MNSEIEKTNDDISKTEKSIEKNTQIYKERICTIYEAGRTSKIEILLSSDNVTEFLTKMETLQVISDHDTKLINDLKTEREKLDAQKKSLEEKYAELEKSKGTLDAKKQAVEVELSQQRQIVASLKNDAADVSNAKKEVKAEQKKTDAQIQAEINRIAEERRKALAAQNHGKITVAGDGNSILGYAEGFIGTPYRLGANNPPYAIDCSAFVMDVFAHFGISLHRCSSNQVSDGTPVSKANMKPCDLVFFDTEGDGVSHVGIYMGNGKFIAANSGRHESGVGIWDLYSSYWAPKFICARRVIS